MKEEVKRSSDRERGATNNQSEDFSGSGESSATAEGSGINMLKDFMLSEKKAKKAKGDPGYKQFSTDRAKIDNKRKNDKLIQVMKSNENSELQDDRKSMNTRLKGDNGNVLSHSERKWLHSFFGHNVLHADTSARTSTNTEVIDKLSHIDDERKQILRKFESSQRESSGASGNYEHQVQSNGKMLEKFPPQMYEKHQKLYEELSQFFPNRNHDSTEMEESSLRPKRHRVEKYDESDDESYPIEIYNDNDEGENDNDVEDDYGRKMFAAAIDLGDYYDEFEGTPRSRRTVDEVSDFKRKISPSADQKYDEYEKGTASSQPVEVPYEKQKLTVSYKEQMTNNIEKMSPQNAFEDRASLHEADYERKKNEYLRKAFGSGFQIESAGNTDYSGSESGNGGSGNFHGLIEKSEKGTSDEALSFTTGKKSEPKQSRIADAAKINMKGPKIGTDPGRPAYLEGERYLEEDQGPRKELHNRKKKHRKYHKESNHVESQKEPSIHRNEGRKNVKQVSHLKENALGDSKQVHMGKMKGKNSKGAGSEIGDSSYSEQLGKVGKAKSRRKRIKLVMEKRKRKAERSLNMESWSSKSMVNDLKITQ